MDYTDYWAVQGFGSTLRTDGYHSLFRLVSQGKHVVRCPLVRKVRAAGGTPPTRDNNNERDARAHQTKHNIKCRDERAQNTNLK